MGYKSMAACVADLEKNGHLIRIKQEVDPNIQMAAIQLRVYAANGPAIYFENVKGSPFPAVSNLFGSLERSRFIFRDTLGAVKDMIKLKGDPSQIIKHPFQYASLPFSAFKALPRRKRGTAAVTFGQTKISQLPQIKSWPNDGGAFITLPIVYSE